MTSSTPASSRATASQLARSIKTAAITFMHWQVTSQELKRTVYGPATQFEHAHSNIHVSVIIAPAGPSYVEKLLTMIAGGVPPDVIGLGGPAAGLPVLASKGALADLGPLIDRDAKVVQPHDFYPQALQVGQWQGKQYGLIISPLSTAVLVYNVDALQKAGVSQTPAQMYDAGKWTWNDFATVARQATMRESGSSMPSQYGFLVPFDIQGGMSFVWEAGGHLLNPQRTKCLLDTAQSIQGLQFLFDLQHKEQVGPPPALQGSASPFGQFTSGRLAMTINWAHQVAITYGPVHFAWDIAPLPVGPQGEIVNDNFNNIALSAKSKHAEAAWSFIKYMTSGPVYLEKEHTALPPRRSVYQAWLKWMQGLPRPKNIQYLALLRKHSRSLPYLPVWPQINVTWPKWTSYLADGTRSPTTVARSLTSAIDVILKQQSA
ncbi:MAG: sugar ABC transporter substrate-binding protein [Chloroflexi bacterium]|nr:sugar ABC transporter substrate-binding protein [Chloroflexota bacterium]